MSDNNLMLLALAGGVAWWYFRGKDALNPMSDKNAAYGAANAAVGLDNKTASVGTEIYRKKEQAKKWLGLDYDKTTDDDWLKKPAPGGFLSQDSQPLAINIPKTIAPSSGLPAKQVSGVWYALEKGKWRPMTRLESVMDEKGVKVIKPWYMRPNA